jgi:outer membrane protein assembly factor BamD
MQKIIFIILLALIAWAMVSSCGSADKAKADSPEKAYEKAMELFKDEDYLDAATYFELITLQYPASPYADDAQFHLAEIDYHEGNYILGAFKYNLLRRVYPGSEYSKESLYKAALCYFEISPKFDRDQEYTKKAIEAFQEFQYLYPEDELSKKSDEKIAELRNKLAHREYFTATLYRKLDSPRSSIIYFDSVINNYNDTEYFEPAVFGKIEVLFEVGKYDEAESIIEVYKNKFPQGDNISNVNEIALQITENKTETD